jgi:hypothetical protein
MRIVAVGPENTAVAGLAAVVCVEFAAWRPRFSASWRMFRRYIPQPRKFLDFGRQEGELEGAGQSVWRMTRQLREASGVVSIGS